MPSIGAVANRTFLGLGSEGLTCRVICVLFLEGILVDSDAPRLHMMITKYASMIDQNS